ncbi:MAG TPA: winged helix-turn-helix domain-containing protein [Terriglobales bacterium]|nr:winged helix-turn-helix domain-containing protein [Terriglobales bacterium]
MAIYLAHNSGDSCLGDPLFKPLNRVKLCAMRDVVPGSPLSARVMQFGAFEVDLQSGELRKFGLKIKLQDQPFQILALLLEHPGQVISREEIRQRLWPADTFVDFDHGLNSAVKKLRQALGDDSDNPRFVETLPRRGYRLIVPVAGAFPAPREQAEAAPSPESKIAGRRRYFGLGILAVLTVTLLALASWRGVSRAPDTPKVLRYTALTNDDHAKAGPMATDGSRIYFNELSPEKGHLIAQVPITGGEVVPLSVPLKQPQVLDLSRDGTRLLVANEEGNGSSSLWMQPVAGGSPRRVGSVFMHDARFRPDGASIIYGAEHDVYSVNLDGSDPRKLLTVDSIPFSFQFSPDGRLLRFTQFNYRVDTMEIMEAATDGTGLHKMLPACCGKWTSDGKFFIFQIRHEGRLNLWALPEARRLRWRERALKPTQLTEGPLSFEEALLSKDGKQIFVIGKSRRAEVTRYDSHTGQFVPYLAGISAEGLAFSRDGEWVTYTSYPDGTLWRSKVDGSERRQLTFPPLRALLPRWSPDGRQIAFNATLPDAGVTWNVYLIPSEGGAPQRILPSEQSQIDVNWSPDGSSLIFGTQSVSNMPIYSFDLRSSRVSALPGSDGLFSPRWSPDGKYIAAISSQAPRILMLFDCSTQRWTELNAKGGSMSWSRDARYIYFQDWSDPAQLLGNRIVRLRLDSRKIENIVDLKSLGRLSTGTNMEWFGLAPDDSPLFARDISNTEIYALDIQWP